MSSENYSLSKEDLYEAKYTFIKNEYACDWTAQIRSLLDFATAELIEDDGTLVKIKFWNLKRIFRIARFTLNLIIDIVQCLKKPK